MNRRGTQPDGHRTSDIDNGDSPYLITHAHNERAARANTKQRFAMHIALYSVVLHGGVRFTEAYYHST